MKVIECITDHKKTFAQIQEETGIIPNRLSATLNYFVRKGYITNFGASFKANHLNFIATSKEDVHRINNQMGEREEVIPEIEVFKPSKELKDQIFELHKTGHTRTEIAKRLVIPKSQVIWTLLEGNK